MKLAPGMTLPRCEFKTLAKTGIETISSESLFQDACVLVIGVIGAFTPVCTREHLPDFIPYAKELKENWLVEKVVCLSVADPFCLQAWGKMMGVEQSITFLTDTNATFTKALELDVDLTAMGLGIRSTRYVMLVKNGVVVMANVEEKPQELKKTSKEAVERSLNSYFSNQ